MSRSIASSPESRQGSKQVFLSSLGNVQIVRMRSRRPSAADYVSAVRQTSRVIAAVAVDVALPHLDRTFDYRVPEGMTVAVGNRVRVLFAGRLVSGVVIAMHDDASHATMDLRAAVSPEVVLTSAYAGLVRAVADRYAGTFADVLRFAVPPRHAKTETAAAALPPVHLSVSRSLEGPLSRVPSLQAFLQRAGRREALRASLAIPTSVDVHAAVADIAAAAVEQASVIIVAPDARDVDRVLAALTALNLEAFVMRAGDGPSVRQRAFTRIAHATRCIVVGTRSAVFAPAQGNGVCIVLSDGHDSLVEPQSPGWHAREVALLRTDVLGWSALLVGYHRSVETQMLIEQGRVKSLDWQRADWRTLSVSCASVPERYEGADPMLQRLRIPPSVFKAVREALQSGSVVLSVAHRGYITGVRCPGCREAARCNTCQGAMGVPAQGKQPRCRVCGTATWVCPWCGGTAVHARTLGIERTREELGRAFPDTPIRIVDAEHPLDSLPDVPHLLLCTAGMEPVSRVPFAVVLDVDIMLARHDLSAAPEAVRRWHDVAASVLPTGRVLIVGAQTAAAVQALVRNDPIGFAEREITERRSAALPPVVHAAVVVAPAGNQAAAEMHAVLPDARLLGPVHRGTDQQTVLLHADRVALGEAVKAVLARRSAAKTLTGISVRMDPLELAT